MAARTFHASAAARSGAGVLVLGPPGAGKSDLVLRLIDSGFVLIADDQVIVDGHTAYAPASLAGLLEVRGLGLVRLPHSAAALVLAVQLGISERLPHAARFPDLDLPMIIVDAQAASAAKRIALALDCLQGRTHLMAGAFT
jgi:HPr kinase/phosphorylase